jgi:cytosine/adenosine deaminase-related metal-dependent hydrolase
MSSYNLLLVGGRVVDTRNQVDGDFDVGIADGKIKAVKSGLNQLRADKIIDLRGKVVIPGVIDPHMHADKAGYAMMAKAGVVTGVDFSQQMSIICENVKTHGSGMNIATLADVRSYGNTGRDMDRKQIERAVGKAVKDGALGVKILGGHSPFSPETTRTIIEVANQERAYVAFHVGTTATGSDLRGLLEAIELAGKNSLHIAHVNSYLRGMMKDCVEECLEGLAAIEAKNNIVSESYLSIINGTSGKCTNGVPDSHVTRNCLRMGKYREAEDGLEKAIREGYSMVNVTLGGECKLLSGSEGIQYWKNAKADIRVSFPVNAPASTFLCAIRKDKKGKFVVDAISTDGGVIPRNVTVRSGLSLVRYGALTLKEFVLKASTNPARMFGMTSKGHLSESADADITVLDLDRGEAVMAIAKGQVIMVDGILTAQEGTLLTTKTGERAVEKTGMKLDIIDLDKSRFYQNSNNSSTI